MSPPPRSDFFEVQFVPVLQPQKDKLLHYLVDIRYRQGGGIPYAPVFTLNMLLIVTMGQGIDGLD